MVSSSSVTSHLLPEQKGWQHFLNHVWSVLFFVIGFGGRIVYLCMLPKFKTLPTDSYLFPAPIFYALGVFVWFQFTALLIPWVTLWYPLFVTLLLASLIEILAWHHYYRPVAKQHDDTVININNVRLKEQRMAYRRNILFCITVGSTILSGYYSSLNQDQDKFEYKGPMRVTNASVPPARDIMKYDSELMPCLEQVIPFPNNIHNVDDIRVVSPTLKIQWGKRWGCRTNTSKWNMNWPIYNPCVTLVCDNDHTNNNDNNNGGLRTSSGNHDASTFTPCSCYKNEESATNASWECLKAAFDTSKFGQNNFDKERPPWEDDDPSWPTIERYGSCKGNVGISMDIDYVEEKMKERQTKRNAGALFMAMGIILAGLSYSYNWT